MIYMDNAATRIGNFGAFNVNSPYASEQRAKFEHARNIIADCVKCSPSNIYFTSGGCEANSWVLQRSGCKRIITTKIEHPSVMNCCKWLENEGYEVTYLDVDEHGYIDIFQLDDVLLECSHKEAVLVSIMAVNNELGTVQDLQSIRKVIDYNNEIRRKLSTETFNDFYEPIYFHSDCVQALGQIDIPVECLDFMSASGHKFGDVYGVGFLYSKYNLEPLIFGGSQEKGTRGGTSNYHSVIKMADALASKMQDNQGRDHTKLMVTYLRSKLKDFDCIINTPEDSTSNILSVSFKGIDSEKLMIFLMGFNIYVSAGSACSTDHKEPSHVLKAINVPEDYLHGTIRFSLSEFVEVKDIDYTLALIRQYGGYDE